MPDLRESTLNDSNEVLDGKPTRFRPFSLEQTICCSLESSEIERGSDI